MSKAQSRESYCFQKYSPEHFMFREESQKHLRCRPLKQLDSPDGEHLLCLTPSWDGCRGGHVPLGNVWLILRRTLFCLSHFPTLLSSSTMPQTPGLSQEWCAGIGKSILAFKNYWNKENKVECIPSVTAFNTGPQWQNLMHLKNGRLRNTGLIERFFPKVKK